MRGLTGRVLLALAGTCVALLVSEGVFRVLGWGNPAMCYDFKLRWLPSSPFYVHDDPEIRIALRPSFIGRMVYERVPDGKVLKSVAYRISKAGLRGVDRPATPEPGTTRILALGDSFTFGEGVHDDETYPAVAERMLQKQGRYEVLNAGVPMWNLHQEVRWLETEGARRQPHIITLGFFVNDLETIVYRNPKDPLPPDVARVPEWATWERGIRQYSFLVNHIARYFERRRLARVLLGTQRDYRDALRAAMDTDEFNTLLQDGLRRFKNQCDLLQARCIVLLLPLLDTFHADPMADLLDRADTEARRLDLETLNMIPALQHLSQVELTVMPGEAHPSARAQEAMGEALASYLARCPTPCRTDPPSNRHAPPAP